MAGLFLENYLNHFSTTRFGNWNFRQPGHGITQRLTPPVPYPCSHLRSLPFHSYGLSFDPFTYYLYFSGNEIKRKVMKVKMYIGLFEYKGVLNNIDCNVSFFSFFVSSSNEVLIVHSWAQVIRLFPQLIQNHHVTLCFHFSKVKQLGDTGYIRNSKIQIFCSCYESFAHVVFFLHLLLYSVGWSFIDFILLDQNIWSLYLY